MGFLILLAILVALLGVHLTGALIYRHFARKYAFLRSEVNMNPQTEQEYKRLWRDAHEFASVFMHYWYFEMWELIGGKGKVPYHKMPITANFKEMKYKELLKEAGLKDPFIKD